LPASGLTRRALLVILVVLGALAAIVGRGVYKAKYEMTKTAYGGGERWTRSAADAHCREHGRSTFLLDRMPDSEFLPEPRP
jgi:hypothetical protein